MRPGRASVRAPEYVRAVNATKLDRLFAKPLVEPSWTTAMASTASDRDRADPVFTLAWGSETITSVRFNQTETSILASCGSDRTVTLYDLRTSKPLSKVVLALRTNALAWNPMEAYHFTLANEDHNLYTFDIRKLSSAAAVHTDHVAPVMDVDYSPTGQEFVTGGYSASGQPVRVWHGRVAQPRELPHWPYAAHLLRPLLHGHSIRAADGNVRLWMADASAKLGVIPRKQVAADYRTAVKEGFKHMPEVRN
ncbi:rRNA-processing protein sof1 [Cladochytrium tenue]|nr:rRNA-processing protein sof1 [Cladochytrium tenue]